jgi:hypothetical protein
LRGNCRGPVYREKTIHFEKRQFNYLSPIYYQGNNNNNSIQLHN